MIRLAWIALTAAFLLALPIYSGVERRDWRATLALTVPVLGFLALAYLVTR